MTSKTSVPSLAVALNYDGENAPHVSAKGYDNLAEEIIAIAQAHNIPITENRELVRILATLELGDEIPETLYLAVAEIIAFAYMIKGKVPENFKPQ